MATTVFDRCGYDAEFYAEEWSFLSEIVDSYGDRLFWSIGLNCDGTFAVKNDDSQINEKCKYECNDFRTIGEAVLWCKTKDLEHLLTQAQEQIETLTATAGSGAALAAKESPDVGNVRSA